MRKPIRKKPRFRTPGSGVLPALLLVALLLTLRLHAPVTPAPPARPEPPPPVPKFEPAPPPRAEPEPSEVPRIEPLPQGCPNGCEVPPAGCEIKGNISRDNERIYHLPGQPWYDVTKITPAKGERWFCTEAEAKANGWRKPRVYQ